MRRAEREMVTSRNRPRASVAPLPSVPPVAVKKAAAAVTTHCQRRSQSESALTVHAHRTPLSCPSALPVTPRSASQSALHAAVDRRPSEFGEGITTLKEGEALDEGYDGQETEKTRRSLGLMTGFITGAIEKLLKGDPTAYQEIIQQLTAKRESTFAPSETKLLLWVRALSRTAAYLTKSCHSLVDAALNIDWAARDANFADGYICFLGNLVSAHAFYVNPVILSLVRGFHWRTAEDLGTEERAKKFDRVHTAIQFILDLIPTATTALLPTLVAEFPNRWASAKEQVTFLHNALRCTHYAPVVRDRLLAVAVDRVIQMDVEVQNDDLLDDSDDESENSDEGAGEIENGIFQCDIQDGARGATPAWSQPTVQPPDATADDVDEADDDGAVSVPMDVQDEEEVKRQQAESIEKLDALMTELFGYLDAQHALATKCLAFARESWASLRRSLLDLFERHILPTYRCRHAPFLIYRFCCIDPSMPDLFLGLCATKLLDNRAPDVTRVAAAAYVASYIARDKRLSPAAVRAGVGLLVGWCNAYLDNYDNRRVASADSPSLQQALDMGQQPFSPVRPPPLATPASPTLPGPDLERHAVFYSVAQAAMYVFCFRWKELRLANDETSVAEAVASGGASALGTSFASTTSSVSSREPDATSYSMSFGENQAAASSLESHSPLLPLARAPFMTPHRRPPRAWASELDGFERIVTSRFAPLRMMSRSVANQFARLSRRLGFLYCHPLLLSSSGVTTSLSTPTLATTSAELPMATVGSAPRSPSGPRSGSASPVPITKQRHQRQAGCRRTSTALQRSLAASSSSAGRASVVLDEFFPFDPYRLPSTRALVEPFYHTWAMALVGLPVGESDSESEDTEKGDDEEEDDEDEDLLVDWQQS